MIRSASQDDREILLRLAQANGGRRTARPNVEAADYDWKAPHRFVGPRRESLKALAASLAGKASARLSSLFGAELRLEAGEIAEHYAGDLLTREAAAAGYSMELAGPGGKECGVILLPPRTAIAWVGRLLGGSPGDAGAERELSSLETELLLDVLTALTEALSAASAEVGGQGFSRGGKVSKLNRLPGQESSEYCRIRLLPSSAGNDPGVSFLILSDALDGRPADGGQADAKAAADLRKRLIGHLGGAPIVVVAHVGQAQVSMRDILAMGPGDVLVLPKRVDEPLDLTVSGNPAFSGLLASCDGRYALSITAYNEGSNDARPPGKQQPAGPTERNGSDG